MVKRMFKRAGLSVDDYKVFYSQEPGVLENLNASGIGVFVVFGNIALQDVIQRKDILRWFNRTVPLSLKDRTVHVVPCIEPSRLLSYRVKDPFSPEAIRDPAIRNPTRYQGAVVGCLRKALDLAEHGVPPMMKVDYLRDPVPMKFRAWVDKFFTYVRDNPTVKVRLSSDIETPYKLSEDNEEDYEERKRKIEKLIIRISFSYIEGEAVSIPWLPEYFDDIKRLYTFTGVHVVWNGIAFDIPILEANEITVCGPVHDGMDMWHLYKSDLDKGLEHVTAFCTDMLPWKHLNDVDPPLYSCIDSDAALRNYNSIKRELEKINLYERFEKEMEIAQILKRAGQRGNKTDEKFRLEFKVELEEMLLKMLLEAQELVTADHYQRKMYKRLPKKNPEKYSPMKLPTKVTMCSKCKKVGGVTIKHKCPEGDGWEKQSIIVEQEQFYKTNPFENATTLDDVLACLKLGNGFNPCSATQMKKYMKFYRHPVGKNHKTDKDTADVKHLQKLIKLLTTKGTIDQHPIYQHALNIRKVQKALSTYVNGLAPDEQGLVHTNYVNSPSTWRLGSRNINVQNLGKRNNNPYAKNARKIIIPRPGHVFISADSSAIEAVFVGYFMNDSKYIQLARKGVHAYVCCQYLNWPFDDVHIERVKTEHKSLYDKFKTTNHSINFGASYYQMHMNDPEQYPTLADAKKMYDFVFKALPGLREWHHQLRVFAQKNGYLDNPWGFRHDFYDVFTYQYDEDSGELLFGRDGLPKVKLGKDGNRVIALKPQSSAGFFMRDNTYIIGQSEMACYMPAVFTIHDGYTLEVPDEPKTIELATEILVNTLTRPIPEMNGLRVGCEVEISRLNFLDMEVIHKVKVD